MKIQLYMVHFLEIYSKNNILAQTLHHITDKFMKSIFIEISKPVEKMDTKNMLRYLKNKAADIDPEIVWIPEAGEIFCGNPQVCQLVSLCLSIDQQCVFVLDLSLQLNRVCMHIHILKALSMIQCSYLWVVEHVLLFSFRWVFHENGCHYPEVWPNCSFIILNRLLNL